MSALIRNLSLAFALLLFTSAGTASAQFTWTGAGSGNWNQTDNWSPNGVPNLPTATASFTGNALGTVNILTSVQTQSLTFSNPTGGYTLTSNASQILSGVTTINVGSGVTGTQTINLANIAGGSLLFPSGNNLTIANNSTAAGTTLVIGSNTVIGTPGSGGVIVTGAGTTNISGSFATVASGNQVVGGLTMNGAGTLILSNPANIYFGGTFVNAGTLMLGSGTAIPTGGHVTVGSAGQFNIGNQSNGPATAIGALSLSGAGTFRVPSGAGDYYLNQLQMTGGTVDFIGTSNFWLHFTGAGAGIAINPGANTWTGAGTSRIQNDTAATINITVANGATLNNGIILANGTGGKGFRLTGTPNMVSTMVLTNAGNTADLTVDSTGYLQAADMAYLGSGALTLQNTAGDFRPGTLRYSGATASSSKPITLGVGGGQIYVDTAGTNLTLSGTIGESSPGQPLLVSGRFTFPSPPMLTLTGANTFTGALTITNNGALSIATIANGGIASPLGKSSSAPANLKIGHPDLFGGTLLYTGPTATTDRGMTLVAYTNTNFTNANVVEVAAAGTNLTFLGQVTGTGGLIKTGPGTITLSGATNNHAGGTFIEAGRLMLGSGTAIPAGGNVTVTYGGSEFNTGGLANPGAGIGTVTLYGGTFRLPPLATQAYYSLNKVVVANFNGGTIDATGDITSSGLVFVNAGASITSNSNSTWIGPNSYFIGNSSGAEMPITIAPFATLTSGLSLASFGGLGFNPFRVTGGGTLYLTNTPGYVANVRVNQARLRMDDLTGVQPNFFNLTLDAGTLAYGGPSVVSTARFALGAGGGTLEVINAATTLNFNGQISGNETAPLTKTGPGTLILSSPFNFYTGGLIVNGGRLDAVGDYQLGFANPIVNAAGTLRYTADSTSARTFTLNNGTLEAPSGVTLTLDGAAVNGGFLRGGGTYTLTGGTALTGVTTFTSANLNVTGPATITNFAHNGNLTVASGQSLAMNFATNASAGRMTINGTANVSDFVSNGQINVPVGGMINNSTSPSGMVLGGGSTTFVGTPAVPGGIINVGSQPMLVRGGLLVNNGAIGNSTGTGQVIVDYGGFAKGTGYYDTLPTTINGGKFSPGNSPGRVTVGSVNMTPGGIYDFEINNATGTAGPTGTTNLSGWDLTIVSNQINPNLSNLTVSATSATPFTINLVTLRNPSPPDIPDAMANFSPTQPFSWLAFDVNTAGSVVNWDPSAIVVNTSQFMNTFNGTFSLVRDTGNPFQFYISYTPVPEPATVLAVAFGGLIVSGAVRRRRAKKLSATN